MQRWFRETWLNFKWIPVVFCSYKKKTQTNTIQHLSLAALLAAEMRKATFDVKHFLFCRTQMAPNSVQVLTEILIFHSYWVSGLSINLSISKPTRLFHMKNSSKLDHHFILNFHLKKVLSSLQLPMLEIIRK